MTDTQRRRVGRPKGEAKKDGPVLVEIAKLSVAQPQRSFAAWVREIKPDAGTSEIRRLQGKWHPRREQLIAEVRAQHDAEAWREMGNTLLAVGTGLTKAVNSPGMRSFIIAVDGFARILPIAERIAPVAQVFANAAQPILSSPALQSVAAIAERISVARLGR